MSDYVRGKRVVVTDPLRDAMRQTVDDWADIQAQAEADAAAAAAAKKLADEEKRRSESLRRALVVAPMGAPWRQ